MNLGRMYAHTPIPLTFDHLHHCWHCGTGSALTELSRPWALYRCSSPHGHYWIRCPVHRVWASVQQLGHINLSTARCLCHVDDTASSRFAILDQWAMEDGSLVPLDSLTLDRAVIDLVLRGNLCLRNKRRVLYYRTRSCKPSMPDLKRLIHEMKQIVSWYTNLQPHTLPLLMRQWRPSLSVKSLHALVDVLNRRQQTKRPCPEEAEDDDTAHRPLKRQRLQQGTKHARETDYVVDERGDSSKKMRWTQGTKRERHDYEPVVRVSKRFKEDRALAAIPCIMSH